MKYLVLFLNWLDWHTIRSQWKCTLSYYGNVPKKDISERLYRNEDTWVHKKTGNIIVERWF